MPVTINCDMGEGFGRYSVADDAALMPLVDLANIACGFHASDPVIMKRTVRLAGEAGVRVGAHPSLPDLQGFGRRAMAIPAPDLTAMMQYQIGALWGFLKAEGLELGHVKPHGALYGMACRDAEVASAIADAVLPYGLPVLGLAGTEQERVYRARGVAFVPEFYADLDYDDEGYLLLGPAPQHRDPAEAAARAVLAVQTGQTLAASGKTIAVRAETICIHSDSGNARDLAFALRQRLALGEAVSVP